jgi:hypothetical protein
MNDRKEKKRRKEEGDSTVELWSDHLEGQRDFLCFSASRDYTQTKKRGLVTRSEVSAELVPWS